MNILITGGAGFIGINTAIYYAKKGHTISIFDNLSRKGANKNLEFIESLYPKNIKFIYGDIRIIYDVSKCFVNYEYDIIFHFAAQVAVTTSVENPFEDFEINARGTFNLLECIRKTKSKAILLYTSTNKVYGGMSHLNIIEKDNKYLYADLKDGINEDFPLDFHSPYGCSKGSADQYVRDYSRIYGIKSIIFRQSCIYGYRQFGVEDQGWVAWFTIAAVLEKPITIYGDGKQVRDVLFIEDLTKAYDLAIQNIINTNGQVYNIGGGKFQMSLLELINHLESFLNKKINIKFSEWRPGDQPVYISNISKAHIDFNWTPQVDIKNGISKLVNWVTENKDLFKF